MVSRERLHDLFTYDNSTGHLMWRVKHNGRCKDIAGSQQKRGYRIIRIDGVGYFAHRLVYLYHRGEIPALVDHINRVKADNRIENLRVADDHMQAMNQSDRVIPNPGRCIVRFDTRWRLHIIRRGGAMDRRIFKCFGQALKARNNFERLERAS